MRRIVLLGVLVLFGTTVPAWAGGDHYGGSSYGHKDYGRKSCRIRLPYKNVVTIRQTFINNDNSVTNVNNVNNVNNFNEFVTNEFTTQINQQNIIREEAPQERFRYYIGGDVRFWELNNRAGAEVQYRYWPKIDTKDEEHNVGLVFKIDLTDKSGS